MCEALQFGLKATDSIFRTCLDPNFLRKSRRRPTKSVRKETTPKSKEPNPQNRSEKIASIHKYLAW